RPIVRPTASLDGSGRDGGRLALDLAEPEDRLDPGDLALGLDDLARRLEPLGLALEPEAKEVLLRFLQEQLELLVGLVAEIRWLAHGRRPLTGWLSIGPVAWLAVETGWPRVATPGRPLIEATRSERGPALHEPATDRQLVGDAGEGRAGLFFGD